MYSPDPNPQRRRRFRRHDDQPGVAPGDGAALRALHAEVVLLREENARLKAAEHELPGLGSLLRRARTTSTPLATREDMGDEAAHMVAEALVMRESLLEACQEITRSLSSVEGKLRGLEPPAS
jgi:hypothetical protein